MKGKFNHKPVIAAMFAAFSATVKCDAADYKSVVAVLKTAPLNDAAVVKLIRDETFTLFGDAHKDAAQIRINIINNARRVAYGGTKDGKAVRGKGVAAMLECAASVGSVRDLKAALADAVPDVLKGKSGGKRSGSGRNAKKTGGGKGAKVFSIAKGATREQAFTAARGILDFCTTYYIKPAETDLYTKVKAAADALAIDTK